MEVDIIQYTSECVLIQCTRFLNVFFKIGDFNINI